MGNPFLEPIDKQDTLIGLIEDYYKTTIASQVNNGDGTVTLSLDSHHFVDNDRLTMTGVTGASAYNDSFEIVSLVNNDVTITVTYNAGAVFTSATITSVSVFNNLLVDLSSKNFCAIIIDVDDTNVIPVAGRDFVSSETFYPIVVMDRIDAFSTGNNTQVRACRRYVSVKLYEILDLLKCKIIGNKIARTETIWSNKKVSLISVTIEY